MSKKSKKQNSPTSNLNSPTLLPIALYFSVHFNDEDEYHEFIARQCITDSILARELLIASEIFPKYFDIIGVGSIFDLKTLISPITLKKSDEGWKVTNTNQHVIDKDAEEYLEIDYAKFLTEKTCNSSLSKELGQLKNNNELPRVIKAFNTPKIVDNYFVMDLENSNDFQLCSFDYNFPQKCVFAIPLTLLGNKKPIEIFASKFFGGIELDEDCEAMLQKMLGNSVESLNIDLLENADLYDQTLMDYKFSKDIENSITEAKNTIIYYDELPVFITFNEHNQLDIRLSFLTFDMYAQNIFLQESGEDIEINYRSYNINRAMATSILDNLGLEYNYVLGQRVDFIHEPEMSNNVITKLKERDIIDGKIYFEESNHHVVGKEDDASLVSLVMIDSLVYPLFVLTMQDKKHIVKQVNAYSLNTHDVSDDNMNDDMEIVSDYFFNMGDKKIKHAVADETGNLSYCKNCLKINGFVF